MAPVQDDEILLAGDMAFGQLTNNKYGWGKIPNSLIGKHFAAGAYGFPVLVLRKIQEFNKKILRCKTCKKEMMPGLDDFAPLNCQTCKPDDYKAYREWQIVEFILQE